MPPTTIPTMPGPAGSLVNRHFLIHRGFPFTGLVNDWHPGDQTGSLLRDIEGGANAVFDAAGGAPTWDNSLGPMVQFNAGQAARPADGSITFYEEETFLIACKPELFSGTQAIFEGLGAAAGGRRLILSSKDLKPGFQSVNGSPTTLIELMAPYFNNVSKLVVSGYRTKSGVLEEILNNSVVGRLDYNGDDFQWGQNPEAKYAFGFHADSAIWGFTGKIGRAFRWNRSISDVELRFAYREFREWYPTLPPAAAAIS